MKLPKFAWVSVYKEMPSYACIYTVFAQINIGSPHEAYATLYLKREPDLPCGWTDLQGDCIEPESTNIIYWLKQVD